MENSINHLKILSMFLFIIILSNIHSEITFKYPLAITLKNNNIFVVDQLGINIYEPTLSSLVENIYNFEDEDKINNEEALSKVIIKKFSNYVIGLINDKIYIFNSEGKMKFKNNTKIVSDQSPKYYTLSFKYTQTDEIIYYLIGYFDNEVQLNLLYYKYDSNLNKTTLLSSKTYSNLNCIRIQKLIIILLKIKF